MGITLAVFQVLGIMFELMILLKSLVITETEKWERCFIWIGARWSGPRALEGFEFFMAVSTWFIVMVIGVVGRLCNVLIVLRLLWSDVKFVGLVKCLLKEFAIALLVVAILLPNLMERLGSVVVGCLLLSDFMVFQ